MKKNLRSVFLRYELVYKVFPLLLFFLLVQTLPGLCAEKTSRFFRIGTGGLTGVYHPIGKLIAQGLTAPQQEGLAKAGTYGVPGLIAVAQTSEGSVANVRALAKGQIEAGLVQADVAAWAYKGERDFAGDDSVRIVRAVASLYPETLHIVTRSDARIRSVSDLRGKRISLDEGRSGTLVDMRIVLDAHDLSENDLNPVYLKPVFSNDKMARGELDGFVAMTGMPMEAITKVANVGIFMVPIDRKKMEQINARFQYLVPGIIPADTYSGVPDTPTLQVNALFVVSANASDDLVYQVTKALWSEHTLSIVKAGHLQGRSIGLDTALNGISVPLHPGAERYYRERGMLPPASQTQREKVQGD